MLGLGDIVMPGLLLCFVLRYDNYKKKKLEGETYAPSSPGNLIYRVRYFHCTLIGYFVGKPFSSHMAHTATFPDVYSVVYDMLLVL